jgi:hypothetical protein
MRDEDEEEREDAARRVREDMHVATERLRARLDALRRIRGEHEPTPGDRGRPGDAPAR